MGWIGTRGNRSNVDTTDAIFLITVISIYISVFTYFSYLRYMSFFSANWDLGIAQQMFWSTTHGKLLYESGDHIFLGTKTFLQVHPTLIAIPVAYIYSFWPNPITLFIIQSAVLSLSAIPLLYIGSKIIVNRYILYSLIILYLISFAITSALLYDFHWESLIPLELLLFFYYLQNNNFKFAAVPLLLGFLTLEAFPFLAIGVILYFAWDKIKSYNPFKLLRDIELRPYIYFAIISVIAFIVYRLVQFVVFPAIYGNEGSLAKVGASVGNLFLPTGSTNETLVTVFFWVMLYVSMGYIPFFHRRHFLIILPIMIFTIFVNPAYTQHFGDQYTFLMMPQIMLGFFYGFKTWTHKLTLGNRPLFLLSPLIAVIAVSLYSIDKLGSRSLLNPTGIEKYTVILLLAVPVYVFVVDVILAREKNAVLLTRRISGLVRKRKKIVLATGLSVLFLLNFLVSPLNQNNYFATNGPGYDFKYSTNPSFQYMDNLTSIVPDNATILSTNILFPYVANDVNAYSLFWSNNLSKVPYFPFNSNHLPNFVLLDSNSYGRVPMFMKQALFVNDSYGVRGSIYNSGFPGIITLYQKNYSGSKTYYYADQVVKTRLYSAMNLYPGTDGTVVHSNKSRFGAYIESTNNSGDLPYGTVWYGPYVTLPTGYYTAVFNISGYAYNTLNQNGTIAYLTTVSHPGKKLFNYTIKSNDINRAIWTNISINFTLPMIYPYVEFVCNVIYTGGIPNGLVKLNYIKITYDKPLINVK